MYSCSHFCLFVCVCQSVGRSVGHDITEILLKAALNTITLNLTQAYIYILTTEQSIKVCQLVCVITDHKHFLYNNTPSKAIVNAASNITYRPLIGADDTGRCT